MSNRDYLLEIGCEEIPARFMPGLLADFKQKAEELFKKYRLGFSGIHTLGTYRRLVIVAGNLSERQADIEEEVKGPPVKMAEQAGPGFLKKYNLEKYDEKDGYLYGLRKEAGKSLKEVMPVLVQELISSIRLPIAMRWGDNNGPFVRPVHWVVSLYGSEIIPLEIFGVKAGNMSRGHRFLENASEIDGLAIPVKDAGEYQSILKKHFVIVDPEERKSLIEKSLAENGVLGIQDEHRALLEEVIFLAEFPKVLKGAFPETYLKIPADFLMECMKKHQKYFPAYQHKKAVINNFFAIADNVTPQNEKSILQGYEAVLLARLEDVKFFWEEDQKTTLDQLLPRLKKVTFQKNLGSMYEKTERIVKLAEWLVTSFGRRGQGRGPEVDKDPILRTARVCKADLVTHTVYELPSLQGKVGYWLAEVSQDSHNVAQGILEHYNGAANPPNRFEGFFVGIADKMDTIVACFINDLIPTSSRDPWAVRQMAGTILSWIIAMNFDINLIAFVDETYRLFDLGIKNRPELLEFLKTRWKGVLTDKGLEYDIVEAVLESSLEAPLESLKKAADSKKFRSEKPDAFKLLVDTAVRTGRLAKNAKSDNVDEKLFAQVEEKTAWVALKESQESLESVAELSAPMTAYFDKVMVMDKDEKIKTNRLAFLARVDALYRRFGDFEKIVV